MIRTISPLELRNRLQAGESMQLIDVRSAGEHAAGHVPQTLNLPMDQVEARLDDLAQTAPLVLVCQSGRRACMTEELLRPHRAEVLILDGGTDGWQSAGFPVVRSTSARWSLERQVRFVAGLLALSGTILAVTVAPAWIYLAMFVGAGLTVAGLTNWCGMALLLAAMPWNKPASTPRPVEAKS